MEEHAYYIETKKPYEVADFLEENGIYEYVMVPGNDVSEIQFVCFGDEAKAIAKKFEIYQIY